MTDLGIYGPTLNINVLTGSEYFQRPNDLLLVWSKWPGSGFGGWSEFARNSDATHCAVPGHRRRSWKVRSAVPYFVTSNLIWLATTCGFWRRSRPSVFEGRGFRKMVQDGSGTFLISLEKQWRDFLPSESLTESVNCGVLVARVPVGATETNF
jgi:hypothetical protein